MKTYLHVFFMLFPCFVFGNDENNYYGCIRGSIFTSDNQPAAYVSVIIESTRKGTSTDDSGNFELKKIKTGNYILHFSLSGYIDSAINVTVKENETTFLTLQLRQTFAELKNLVVEAHIPKYVETKTSESLRLNLPLIEVPQNIVVIPHQLLTDQGLVSMTQAIRNVSGVVKVYGEMNDYSLMIRGTDATYNVFRNGAGGDWWNQQEDVAMLEKIELVKGPAGFMGSMSEPGGFVNVVTKQPTKERIVNVDMGFGSYNMMRLTTDLGGSLTKSGKFYYRFVAGVHTQRREFRFGKAIRYFICPALTYEFNKKTSVTAEYNYMYGKTTGNNDNLPSINGKMFQLPRDFAVADAATDAITSIDNYYRLHFHHDFDSNWHLNVQVASVSGPWNGDILFSDYDASISNDTLYRLSVYWHFINYAHPAYAFIDGKFSTGRRIEHKVLFGVDYHNQGAKGSTGGSWGQKKFGLYIPNPDYYVNPDSLKYIEIQRAPYANTRWIALYVQDHIKIAEKLVVTLAGHFTHSMTIDSADWVTDDQKRNTDNVFTPRAGLTWLFGEKASVFVLYDQCFLPQTGRSFEPKPIKPLTGYNIETGFKSFFFSKKLSLNVSVFNIVKDNMLKPDPLHPEYHIPIGQVVSKGIDFDMTGSITPSFIVNANYEYLNVKVTKDSDPSIIGAQFINTPDHQGNLWLQYKVLHGMLKGLSFSMGDQYLSKRSVGIYNWVPYKTKFLPGYNLLDAGISFSNDRFNIGLHFYNITNIQYASTGYFNFSSNEWRYTPGEPVNFRLSFGVNLIHQ